MFADFRKAFFPTEEESRKQKELIRWLEQDEIDFWFSQGLTNDQISKLRQLEIEEYGKLNRHQFWISRKALVEDGIITISDVINDIS